MLTHGSVENYFPTTVCTDVKVKGKVCIWVKWLISGRSLSRLQGVYVFLLSYWFFSGQCYYPSFSDEVRCNIFLSIFLEYSILTFLFSNVSFCVWMVILEQDFRQAITYSSNATEWNIPRVTGSGISHEPFYSLYHPIENTVVIWNRSEICVAHDW